RPGRCAARTGHPGAGVHTNAADKTSAGHLSALLCGQFSRGNCRRLGLFGGDREIPAVPRLGQAARYERPWFARRESRNESWKFMKPCSKNQKRIAWLALDALDVRQAHDLRAHLETCAGCRRYLVEISNMTRRLTEEENTQDSQDS